MKKIFYFLMAVFSITTMQYTVVEAQDDILSDPCMAIPAGPDRDACHSATAPTAPPIDPNMPPGGAPLTMPADSMPPVGDPNMPPGGAPLTMPADSMPPVGDPNMPLGGAPLTMPADSMPPGGVPLTMPADSMPPVGDPNMPPPIGDPNMPPPVGDPNMPPPVGDPNMPSGGGDDMAPLTDADLDDDAIEAFFHPPEEDEPDDAPLGDGTEIPGDTPPGP